jgi:hypothetical protein
MVSISGSYFDRTEVPLLVNIVFNEIEDHPVGWKNVYDFRTQTSNNNIRVMLCNTRKFNIILEFTDYGLYFYRENENIKRPMLAVEWVRYTSFREHYHELVKLFPEISYNESGWWF